LNRLDNDFLRFLIRLEFRLVRDAALDLVALGLDPEQAALFVQSDVPEVTELTWLLMTVTPMGLLERCHAYKDKKSRGIAADVLMETAGAKLARCITQFHPQPGLLVCSTGKGHNAGDAFVAARHLSAAGWRPPRLRGPRSRQ
jgi:hypothetical protein